MGHLTSSALLYMFIAEHTRCRHVLRMSLMEQLHSTGSAEQRHGRLCHLICI
jgi:hypothetical protein